MDLSADCRRLKITKLGGEPGRETDIKPNLATTERFSIRNLTVAIYVTVYHIFIFIIIPSVHIIKYLGSQTRGKQTRTAACGRIEPERASLGSTMSSRYSISTPMWAMWIRESKPGEAERCRGNL